MTYRTSWTPPGHFAPAWADHDTEASAHRHAMGLSRDLQVEVAVIELPEEDA